MSKFDEDKVNRAPAGTPDGGKFASGDARRDEMGQLDGVFSEPCPLCGEPIDYCQGHGEWNSSEEVAARDLRPGDRVFEEGKVVNIRHDDGDMLYTTDDGYEHRIGLDDTLNVLDDEREWRSYEEFGVSATSYKVDPGHWHVDFESYSGESARFDYFYPGDHEPNPDHVVDDLAANARDIDGVSYENFCRNAGYEPDDDLHHEFNEAIAEADSLRRVLGKQGYSTIVFGDPSANSDIPTPIRKSEPEPEPIFEPQDHNDERYEDAIEQARDTHSGEQERWTKKLTEIHGYDITDDDAHSATDDKGWQHITHDVELEDPDTGAIVRLSYRRGLSTSTPDAGDIVSSYVYDLGYARDYDWNARDLAATMGEDPDDDEVVARYRRDFAKLREFEAFLGDRADLYLGNGEFE